MLKYIIFDYAGVLTPTTDNYKFALKYADEFNLSPVELLDITYVDWDKALIAEVSPQSYWQNIASKLNCDPNELKSKIIETFPIDNRVVDYIDEIKSQYTICMLSNQIEDWLEPEIDKHGLRSRFEHYFNSYQLGLAKPDPRIFKKVLETLKCDPSECLFTDDNTTNIEIARSLGMNALVFTNFDNFEKEFSDVVNAPHL